MKLSGFSPILLTLMRDRMDIYRYTEQVNTDGTTSNILGTVPFAADVRCHLSFSVSDSPKDSAVDETPIRFAPMIFFPTGIELKAGDEIVVRKMQDDGTVLATYKGQVAMPKCYPTHKEVNFFIKESA